MTSTERTFTLPEIIKARQERSQFLLVQGDIEKTESRVHIYIPANTAMVISPEGRNAFEHDKSKWRWAAGGLLMILECEDGDFAVLRYRDSGAPTFKEHYTLGSGLSATLDELINPLRTAVREGIEEFLVLTKQGLVVPMLKEEGELAHTAALAAIANFDLPGQTPDISQEFLQAAGEKRVYFAAAEFINLSEQEFAVEFEGVAPIICKGLSCIDETTRGIDLLKALRITIPCPSSAISILDGERNKKNAPLNGEVVMFPIRNSEFIWEPIAAFKSGQRIEPVLHSRLITPVVKTLIGAL